MDINYKEIFLNEINNLLGSFDRDNIDREIIESIHQEVDNNILK
jgi:hypothetical protein